MPAGENAPERPRRRGPSTSQVLVVTSVMFTFISYWRTAAIVLCDLASTAYYIGGIVESQIGPAAPWFILAVMLFSYAVRSVYIESCAMFVRGGVYRVVKEAMGGTLAKLSVSALMFDYILTGPISGVSAGQYIVGWLVDFFHLGPEQSAGGEPEPDRGGHRHRHHPLLLAGQPQGHPRVERPGAEDHGGHHGHGGHHDRLVPAPPWRSIPEKHQVAAARPRTFDRKVDPITHEPMLDPLGKQVDPLGFLGRTTLGEVAAVGPDDGQLVQPARRVRHPRSPSATRSWR